ncbi:gp28 [Rhodococcus phage ReqiPine5]|uniref:Gp28 n=1 Tax=Rhodococcus phage ReqiPine5 TaxID=691963 RepID=D4P803_9CAUD|nr:gp28 [Rhodococcus phage ReqiPine5]ADD81133.1 gp28 [Rhodococcus phage ReqiPine5]
MAYRGYFEFGGEELSNTARVIDHIRGLSSTDEAALQAQLPGGCASFEVGYDDSWSGWHEFTDTPEYDIATAPWVEAFGDTPISRQFLGIWVMDAQGLDTATYSTTVSENLGDGGNAGMGRSASRAVRFTALVIGTTDAGAQLGMRWLGSVLSKRALGIGDNPILRFLPFTPEGAGLTDAEVNAAMAFAALPAVTQMPEIVDVSGLGGGSRHRQSTIRRVEFTITFQDPSIYTIDAVAPVTLTKSTGPVQWVKDGDCFDSDACTAHIAYPPTCEGNIPSFVEASPVMPSCPGCLPLCDIATWVGTVPIPAGSQLDYLAIGMLIRNAGTAPLSGSFYFRSTVPTLGDPRCARFGAGAINALGPGESIQLDPSARGVRLLRTDGTPLRSVGYLTAITGAPYRMPTIPRPPAGTLELVVEGAPTSALDIDIYAFRRIL